MENKNCRYLKPNSLALNFRNRFGRIKQILKLGDFHHPSWGGSPNFSAFEKTLVEPGIIRRGFTSRMLGSGKFFVIKEGRIVSKALFVDAVEIKQTESTTIRLEKK